MFERSNELSPREGEDEIDADEDSLTTRKCEETSLFDACSYLNKSTVMSKKPD